jgi:hypothetical protein
LRRVDIIVQELKDEIITRVGDGEILRKNFIESGILTILRRSVELQEVSERLELYLQKVREREWILYGGKINTRFFGYSVCHWVRINLRKNCCDERDMENSDAPEREGKERRS